MAAAAVASKPPVTRPALCEACRRENSGRCARASSRTPAAFIATSMTLFAAAQITSRAASQPKDGTTAIGSSSVG
jgi:hypothetical protein